MECQVLNLTMAREQLHDFRYTPALHIVDWIVSVNKNVKELEYSDKVKHLSFYRYW